MKDKGSEKNEATYTEKDSINKSISRELDQNIEKEFEYSVSHMSENNIENGFKYDNDDGKVVEYEENEEENEEIEEEEVEVEEEDEDEVIEEEDIYQNNKMQSSNGNRIIKEELINEINTIPTLVINKREIYKDYSISICSTNSF